MEIELKYRVSDAAAAEALWADEEIARMEEAGTRTQEEMHAVYSDTPELALLKHDIAYRIRLEGGRVMAALKWNGRTEGPLHTREELSINLGEGQRLPGPDPAVFSQSDIGSELLGIIDGHPMEEIIAVDVSRRSVRVDTSQAIIEFALDQGSVKTKNGTCPICEVELELYSGKEEELLRLGELIAGKYGLQPEPKSKFARGLLLLGYCDTNQIEGE